MAKSTKLLLFVFSILIIITHNGCAPDEEPKCGSFATSDYGNVIPTFYEMDPFNNGVAHFRYICGISNACIDEIVHIWISFDEITTGDLTGYSAFSLVQNSTTPQINFNKTVKTYKAETDINLLQGYKKGPGAVEIIIHLYIKAANQTEAIQKFPTVIQNLRITYNYFYHKN